MTVKELLTKARNKIKKGWTRGAYARNKYGKEIFWHSKNACRFCAVGAVKRMSKDDKLIEKALSELRRRLPDNYGTITCYNDQHKKEDVINLFNRAIDGK